MNKLIINNFVLGAIEILAFENLKNRSKALIKMKLHSIPYGVVENFDFEDDTWVCGEYYKTIEDAYKEYEKK